MVYVEFVLSDKKVASDLKAIYNVGMNSGDAAKGIAERSHALRSFIHKWDGKVSKNRIRAVNSIISIGEVYGNSMPELPDPKAHIVNTPEGFAIFWGKTTQAWKDLILFKNREARGQLMGDGVPAINRFMEMTEKIKALIPADIFQKTIGKDSRQYTFVDHPELYPNRLISKVEHEGDIIYFRELAKATSKACVDITRWRVFDTLEAVTKAKQYRYEANEEVLKKSSEDVVVPTMKAADITEEELGDDKILIDGKILKAEIVKGVKIPFPTEKKGTRYGKTVLLRSPRIVLQTITDRLVEQKCPPKLPEENLTRPKMVEYILKVQKKRDVYGNIENDQEQVPDGNPESSSGSGTSEDQLGDSKSGI